MNITELLNVIIANRIADMHICMPAKIISYDYILRKATVQPALNQKYNDGEVIKLPIIHNVPVIHPATSSAAITFPIKKDDTVLLIFSERSLEEWLQDGKQVTPDDPRQNDLTDAVALIGLMPFSKQSPVDNADDLLISYNDAKIRLKNDGTITAQATTINLTATDVNVSGKLTANELEATTEMKSATANIGGKDFATHIHSGVMAGGANTGAVV